MKGMLDPGTNLCLVGLVGLRQFFFQLSAIALIGFRRLAMHHLLAANS